MARKILLADDSVTAQNMGRKILTEAGYEVITVNNGSAALKRITEQKPDVIVLDVYMPGYGGLEVCHRLKENSETARIPVLLTVGKLEPFKVEEARRVRADMHIIKPFDTSELLSAIAKLEDRIVAQAEMPKKGRFAKPGAEDLPPADSYGDQQSGWKSRLIAPRKKAKAEKSESKIEARDEIKDVRPEPPRPSNSDEGVEEDTVNTKDWRTLLSAREAEERATAAKASGHARETAEKAERDEPKFKDEKLAREGQERDKEQVITGDREFVTASTESAAAIVARAEEAIKLENSQERAAETTEVAELFAQAPPKTANADIPTSAEAMGDQGTGESHDRDVADALASLVPATSAVGNDFVNDRELVASGSHVPRSSGPRWMAQAVLVSQEESSSLLEQEMEQAFKHFAAAEPPASFSMGPLEAMSFSAPADEQEGLERQSYDKTAQVAESATPVASMNVAVPEQRPDPQLAASIPAETETEARAESKDKADEKARFGSESAPASDNSMGALWMSAPAAYVAATAGPAPAENQGAQINAEVPAQASVESPAAFAAAAGASVPSFAAGPEPERTVSGSKESELAAAWQSWRQGREEDALPAAQTAAVPEEKVESNTDDENHGEEISSLVDTMLAELKPKLMKEIAKKMGKESKK